VDYQNPIDPRGPKIPPTLENVRAGGPFISGIDPMILL